jgi:3-oxoacyl-[acyl-carrier-protein] synthase II
MSNASTPEQAISKHKTKLNPGNQRAVITGMSAITPLGNTLQDTWQSLIAGRSGAGPITLLDASNYPCQVSAELKGFDPEQYIPRKKARHLAFASQLAVVAAIQAIDHAALDLEQVDRDNVGVILGTAGGSIIEETEIACKQLTVGNSRRLSPFQVLRLWPNMPAYFVAEFFKLRGYSSTVCTACASATQAIGDAARMIRRGEAEVILAGGSESMVSETALAGFSAMRAISTKYNHEPHRAMRPFDADREMGSSLVTGARSWCWRVWTTPYHGERSFMQKYWGPAYPTTPST